MSDKKISTQASKRSSPQGNESKSIKRSVELENTEVEKKQEKPKVPEGDEVEESEEEVDQKKFKDVVLDDEDSDSDDEDYEEEEEEEDSEEDEDEYEDEEEEDEEDEDEEESDSDDDQKGQGDGDNESSYYDEDFLKEVVEGACFTSQEFPVKVGSNTVMRHKNVADILQEILEVLKAFNTNK